MPDKDNVKIDPLKKPEAIGPQTFLNSCKSITYQVNDILFSLFIGTIFDFDETITNANMGLNHFGVTRP